MTQDNGILEIRYFLLSKISTLQAMICTIHRKYLCRERRSGTFDWHKKQTSHDKKGRLNLLYVLCTCL